jgi:DNA helicase-2/ATP-dependent DNA helicase PcrA
LSASITKEQIPMAIDFKAQLNEQQRQVVTAPDGPVLVIAAAGTGKTRALTYRVAYLVDHRQIDPARILLLTFTNKAAREMLERAVALVGESVGGLWGGTFHHMANRLLRRHAQTLHFPSDYGILDQDDSRSLIRTCLDDLKLKGKEFPKPEVLGSLFSLAANRNMEVGSLAQERFAMRSGWTEDILRVHAAYVARKQALQVMDFDDLLVNGLRLFQTDPLLLQRYRTHFQYILVDEYQDTNIIQSDWIDLLAAGHRNLLAVGDDFQSIYAWRGADYRNIMQFPIRYPDAVLIKLEINYRSVPEILQVANACIAGNPEQFQKTLRPMRDAHKRPYLVRPYGATEQARYIIDRVAHLQREGYALEQMAILYRAHFHAMEIQLELTRADIPYVLTSGVRFFEQAHIKDVCAAVRLAVRFHDELAFVRLLSLFPKIGHRTALKVWEKLGRRFPADDPDAMSQVIDHLPAGARDAWKPVGKLYTDAAYETFRDQPGEVIQRYLAAFYETYAAAAFDSYERRIEEIRELATFASRYPSTEAFINEIALLTNVDARFGEARTGNRPGIRLSTVHQAKGLEWEVVFVPWLTDGLFPSLRSMNESDDDAEERRLFYVCTTRAKDELYLCAPGSRRSRDGGIMSQILSRFISELPSGLLQRQELSVY